MRENMAEFGLNVSTGCALYPYISLISENNVIDRLSHTI